MMIVKTPGSQMGSPAAARNWRTRQFVGSWEKKETRREPRFKKKTRTLSPNQGLGELGGICSETDVCSMRR